MKKVILSALAAVALAGSAYTISAIAAPDAAMHEGGGFLLDAKLAGIHAALKLNADQDKNWAPFEAAVRDAAKQRMEARKAMREERDGDARPSPIAMMTEMSDHLAKASEELKKVADAAKPLYDSLDDGQKRHFGPLVHMLRENGGHRGWRGEEGEPGHKL
jgi:hypothetical protein